jgi:hypothetical protein
VKVHLVDGTYELFRAFYAVPEARDAEGVRSTRCGKPQFWQSSDATRAPLPHSGI